VGVVKFLTEKGKEKFGERRRVGSLLTGIGRQKALQASKSRRDSVERTPHTQEHVSKDQPEEQERKPPKIQWSKAAINKATNYW
jgi:hypothetical protein